MINWEYYYFILDFATENYKNCFFYKIGKNRSLDYLKISVLHFMPINTEKKEEDIINTLYTTIAVIERL
jgi:hypothetical protein